VDGNVKTGDSPWESHRALRRDGPALPRKRLRGTQRGSVPGSLDVSRAEKRDSTSEQLVGLVRFRHRRNEQGDAARRLRNPRMLSGRDTICLAICVIRGYDYTVNSSRVVCSVVVHARSSRSKSSFSRCLRLKR
jgi:hypothetical protein